MNIKPAEESAPLLCIASSRPLLLHRVKRFLNFVLTRDGQCIPSLSCQAPFQRVGDYDSDWMPRRQNATAYFYHTNPFYIRTREHTGIAQPAGRLRSEIELCPTSRTGSSSDER